MTPNSWFKEFLSDIEPSATTKSNASDAHSRLRERLRKDTEFSLYHLTDFLSGSYTRDTAVRPRVKDGSTDRPDVDIVVVTNHNRGDDSREVVDLLFGAIKRAGYAPVRRQARSVGLGTTLADTDVVPLIEPFDGEFFIPDRKQESWLPTNPPGHTSWTTETNQRTAGRFKSLVKLFKWWRRENPTVGKRPKGFVLEVIAADCMPVTQAHFGELFVGTLETIMDRYATSIALGMVPAMLDPSLPSNSVTDGMTFDSFKGFYDKAALHARLGRDALSCDDESATERSRQIFGTRFPGGPSQSAKGLLAATVPASDFAFPNCPVTPSKKRKGFA